MALTWNRRRGTPLLHRHSRRCSLCGWQLADRRLQRFSAPAYLKVRPMGYINGACHHDVSSHGPYTGGTSSQTRIRGAGGSQTSPLQESANTQKANSPSAQTASSEGFRAIPYTDLMTPTTRPCTDTFSAGTVVGSRNLLAGCRVTIPLDIWKCLSVTSWRSFSHAATISPFLG